MWPRRLVLGVLAILLLALVAYVSLPVLRQKVDTIFHVPSKNTSQLQLGKVDYASIHGDFAANSINTTKRASKVIILQDPAQADMDSLEADIAKNAQIVPMQYGGAAQSRYESLMKSHYNMLLMYAKAVRDNDAAAKASQATSLKAWTGSMAIFFAGTADSADSKTLRGYYEAYVADFERLIDANATGQAAVATQQRAVLVKDQQKISDYIFATFIKAPAGR
jgi:hypothetical protein